MLVVHEVVFSMGLYPPGVRTKLDQLSKIMYKACHATGTGKEDEVAYLCPDVSV
jgi:hypothetical protein